MERLSRLAYDRKGRDDGPGRGRTGRGGPERRQPGPERGPQKRQRPRLEHRRARPPGEAPEPEDALDLGSRGDAVIADRLRDPRRLAGLLGLVALIAFVLGRRPAR
jgi:hypothetical protein